MSMPYTSVAALLLGMLYLTLSVNVILFRYRTRTAILDNGDQPFRYAIRAHANFAEYVPFWLMLYGLLEVQHGQGWLLCLAGALMVIGRLSHAFSLIRHEIRAQTIKFRQVGMVFTFTSYLLCMLGLVGVLMR